MKSEIFYRYLAVDEVDRGKETPQKLNLVIGKKYFVPCLGEVCTYCGRGPRSYVLVRDNGSRVRSPYIFRKLGGLLEAGVTEDQAREAVLSKK